MQRYTRCNLEDKHTNNEHQQLHPHQTLPCPVTLKRVQQHLLSNVLVDLGLRSKAGVFSLQTHTRVVTAGPGLITHAWPATHRAVRPVGVVKGEALGSVSGLLGVGDACRRRKLQ